MKKLISLLVILTLVLSLCACGEIKYDEARVKSDAERLIRESEILNEIYWGEGIGYIEDIEFSSGYYYIADDLSLKKYGIKTIEDLKALTRKTLSEGYSQSVFEGSLVGVSDEGGVRVFARYYQKYSENDLKTPEYILVYSKYEPFLKDEVEYLYDTLKVLNSDSERVYVEIDALVTREEKTQTRTLKIGLVEENGEYKIDTPTYLTYFESEK